MPYAVRCTRKTRDTLANKWLDGRDGQDRRDGGTETRSRTFPVLPLLPFLPFLPFLPASIDDGIDEPPAGRTILKDAIDGAIGQRHIPFVAIPRGRVGQVGRVGLVGRG